MVQWLGHHVPNAGAWVQCLVRERDPHATLGSRTARTSSHDATKIKDHVRLNQDRLSQTHGGDGVRGRGQGQDPRGEGRTLQSCMS